MDDPTTTHQINHLHHASPWIGRFAPSPSGPLHFGSLVAAIASYMIAKSQAGQWLVRIEDLDPPREVEGAAKQILTSLEAFGLYWDGEVVYQSKRQALYQQKLMEFKEQKIVYFCTCSRKDVENRNKGVYDGHCRNKLKIDKGELFAVRIKFAKGFESFTDQIQGECRFNTAADQQDFIIKRRDGLFAYQLAVVCDDIEQGVNHVVRGLDIIDSTPRQNFLYHCWSKPEPLYYHIPLVLDEGGRKLSKSSGALALDQTDKTRLLLKAFEHLGQKTDSQMLDAKPEELVSYYTQHWQTSLIK